MNPYRTAYRSQTEISAYPYRWNMRFRIISPILFISMFFTMTNGFLYTTIALYILSIITGFGPMFSHAANEELGKMTWHDFGRALRGLPKGDIVNQIEDDIHSNS